MTHPLDKNTNSNPDLVNSQLYPKSVNEDGEEVEQNMEGQESEQESIHLRGHQQQILREHQRQWADEVRRADQRWQQLQQKYDHLVQVEAKSREVLQIQDKKIEARDNEIRRLTDLYQGGQNLERLNIKYHQEVNEQTVTKLQSQVDFLNKENHRLQSQVDLYTSDRGVVDQIDNLKKEIDDLTFENSTIRKDMRELTGTLKDYQEKEFRHK